MAAIRTNDSYLQAQYRRLTPRIGHGRALGAVKHSILCAIWHMLSTGELYRDLGGDYFRKRDPERQIQAARRPDRTSRPQGHPPSTCRGSLTPWRNPPRGYTRGSRNPAAVVAHRLFSTQRRGLAADTVS